MTDEFSRFVEADTCKDAIAAFERLCATLGLQNTDKTQIFQQLSSKLTVWKIKSLMEKFKKRFSMKDYKDEKMCSKTRVLVIGAGPCGLRTAIEAAFLGCRVVLIEKRTSFTRNNVLHLWQFVVTDLKNLGAKHFYGRFCCGELNHICIKRLQLILLKVALILGVEIHLDVAFKGLLDPPTDQNARSGWCFVSEPSDHVVSKYEFDVLVGATGTRDALLDFDIYSSSGNIIKTQKGFERKEVKNRTAIAISANFVNNNTDAELKVKEWGGVFSHFEPEFFKNLKKETQIELENFVYFKSDTHYFVMTPTKRSLLAKGVFKKDYAKIEDLMSRVNTDPQALMNYAKQVANHCTRYSIPSLTFAKNKDGKPDVAMIDFSTRYQSENASRVIERHGRRLLISLVGDSLLEPFWPSGTGCAKGFLGALDAAWMIKRWSNYTGSQPPIQILSEREHIFKFLPQTTQDNLKKKYMDYTVDPQTRYQNLNLKLCKSEYGRQYYTCDDQEYQEDTDQGINSETILSWCKRVLNGRFKHVHIEDFTTSWRTGLALCALIYTFRPDIIDYHSLSPQTGAKNNQLAIDTAQRKLGISACLSGKEIALCSSPADDLKMSSYLFLFYSHFSRERIPSEDWSGYEEPESQKKEIYQKKQTSPVKEKMFFPNKKASSDQSSTKELVGNVCYFCKKRLYIMERMNIENIFFHRKCFKCHKCSCELSLDDYRMKKSSSGEVKFFCQRHADSALSRSRRKGFFKKSAEKLKMSIRNVMNMQTSPESVEAPEISLPSRPDFLLSRVSKSSIRAEFYNNSEDMTEESTSEKVEKSSLSAFDHERSKGDFQKSSASANVEKKFDKKSYERDVQKKVEEKADEREVQKKVEADERDTPTKVYQKVNERHAPKKDIKKTDESDVQKKVEEKAIERDTPRKVDKKTDESDVQRKVEEKADERSLPRKVEDDSKMPVNTNTVLDTFDALQKFEEEREESSSLSCSEDDSVVNEEKQNKQDPECVETLEKNELPAKEENPEQAEQVKEKPHAIDDLDEVEEKPAKIDKSLRVLKPDKSDTPKSVQEMKNRPDSPPRLFVKPEESNSYSGDKPSHKSTMVSKLTEDDPADNLDKSDIWLPPPCVEKTRSRTADDVSDEGSSKLETNRGTKEEGHEWEVVSMEELKPSGGKEIVTELAGANLQKTLRRNVTIGEAKNIFEKLLAGPTDPPPVQRGKMRTKSTPAKGKLWDKNLSGDIIHEESEDKTTLQKEMDIKKPEDIPPKVLPRTNRISPPVQKFPDSVIPARPEVSPDQSVAQSDTDKVMTRDKDQITTSDLDKAKTETEVITRPLEETDVGGATSNVITNSESSDTSDNDEDEDEEIREALQENFGKTLRRNITIDEARKIFDVFQKTKTLERQEIKKPKLFITGRGEAPVLSIPKETAAFKPNYIPDILDKRSEEQTQVNKKKFEAAVKNLDDEKHEMETENYRRKLWTTCYNPGKRNIDSFDFKKKQTENISSEISQGRPKLHRSNSDEADIRRAQRVQLAARKLARNVEQQRVNVAQELKLQLEEAEVKLMEVEERGAEIERALEDESVDGRKKSNLMQELFTLTIHRNQLLQYEEQLVALRMQLDEDVALDKSMESSFGKSSGVTIQKSNEVDSVYEDDGDDEEEEDDDDDDDDSDKYSEENSSDDDISKLVPKDSTLDDDISGLLPTEQEDTGNLILPQIGVDLWECAFCTLHNKHEADFCDACNAWRCRICTLVNMNNQKKCDACSQNRPLRSSNTVTLGSQRQESCA